MTVPEPIAIVGSACRFPGGSDTPSKLWELLRDPRELQRKPDPERRYDAAAFYHADPEHHGTTNMETAYFLDQDPALFDNGFFNIQPAECESIDPQQRLLMETVYDAITAAGQTIEGLRGSSTAVLVGLMNDDWGGMLSKDLDTLPQYGATGMGRSILSNRISYFFDWHGPSVTLDTACSSSLVAVHLAVQSLLSGESRVALAGGSNLILAPGTSIVESNLHMLSPTGTSKMWDKDVDGYARGEGISAVVLKTLSAAIADGDHIECLIRATGVNQDGKTSGLTMPSAAAQEQLIRDTYARAGLDLAKAQDHPQFFHAHGTGTPAGDPREAEAIWRAFCSSGDSASEHRPLYVGSIKTVIGHTEGAAGLASLIASSLSLQHGVIPPNLHFCELNPQVAPFYGGLQIPTKAMPWPSLLPGQPRRVSVNSFGFGGTNAHAILEAYEPPLVASSAGPLFTPLTFSGASEKSLRALLASHSAFLKEHADVSLRDFAYTLQERRSTLAFRATVSASTPEAAARAIDALLGKEDTPELGIKHFGVPSPRILGVFTGQGAQWPRMGASLVAASPFVAARLDELDAALAVLPTNDRPDWTLRAQLDADAATSRIAEAALSQPLCTAVQIVLVDLLRLAGIELHAVVGHSSGEIGAAYAAGLLTADAAIRTAYYRGLHAGLARSPTGARGAMLAVGTSFEDASELVALDTFQGRLQVAARNSPTSITLSGDQDAVAEAAAIFTDEGAFARQLKVDTAYHSVHMLPCSGPYLASIKALGDVAPSKTTAPRPTWYSSVLDGQPMTEDVLDEQYWVDNMTHTVLFAPAVASAASQSGPFDLVLEIGPHPALKGPCTDSLAEATGDTVHAPYLGLLTRGKDDVASLSTALGSVWTALGAGSVAFGRLQATASGDVTIRQVLQDLPKYVFDHSRSFWSMSRIAGAHTAAGYEPPHPILGRRQTQHETSQEIQWRNIFSLKEIGWLKGHRIQGQIVFPATGYVVMALEAVKAIAGSASVALVTLQDLDIGRAIVFNDERSRVECLFTVTILHVDKHRIEVEFTCCSGAPDDLVTPMGLNAKGRATAELAEPEPDRLPFTATTDWNMNEVEVERFYDQAMLLQYEYSAPFHGMRSIRRRKGYATGTIEDEAGSDWEDNLSIHPALLDTALQSSSAAFGCPGDGRMWGLFIPARIQRITINPHFGGRTTPHQVYPWEAVLRSEESMRSITDVTVFSPDGAHTFVQMEGLDLIPLIPARPDDDVVLLSHFEYAVDGPDGERAAPDVGFGPKYVDDALRAERAAFFYLRCLVDAITPEEKAATLPHYQRLLDWATKSVNQVKSGKNPFVSASYVSDTEEQIDALMERDRERADMRMLVSVGRNLAHAIRTRTSMLEQMTQNGLFDFYDDGLGLDIANRQFARLVAQMAHRYPHMKVLEIGAGTGGSTRHLLPALGSAFSSYTYTDISSAFFEPAQTRFSEYAGRMVFKQFDMERPPAEQGFVPGSFDLVVASNVLHATDKLAEMMTSVRQLLKPGGQLINLELTSNDLLRVGLPVGCLAGWWVGAESGRRWGPTLTLPQWDTLLRNSGFAGIDTSTPMLHKLHANAVFAAQAVDDRVVQLRAPLLAPVSPVAADAPRLVILGGETLTGHRLAEQLQTLLAPRYSLVERLASLEGVDEEVLVRGSTVLSLVELDEPLFRNLTPGRFTALQTLWREAGTVLWVTRGSRTEQPHSAMTTGLGRVIKFEYPNVLLQILDFDRLDDKTTQTIAEQLLRLEILKQQQQQQQQPGTEGEILWSIEPEVYVESGAFIIPRLYQSKAANARYNSARRVVTSPVDPQNTPVLFAGVAGVDSKGPSYRLLQPSPLRLPTPAPLSGQSRNVQITHFLLQAVRVPSVGRLLVCAGIDTTTGEQLLALSPAAESPVALPTDWTTPLGDADPASVASLLVALAAHITAHTILQQAPRGSTVVVHEPDEVVALALARQAVKDDVKTVATTSSRSHSSAPAASGWCYIPDNASLRLIQNALPTGAAVSVFADLSQAPGPVGLGQRVLESLHRRPPVVYGTSDLFGTQTALDPGFASGKAAEDALKEAWLAIGAASKSQTGPVPSVPAVPLGELSGTPFLQRPLTVIDCTGGQVPAQLQAVDQGTLFRPDRTYFLVGLSGETGQSLCRWMVERGARYVALTSRRPKVSSEFLRSVELLGATVCVKAVDVTNRESVLGCCKDLAATMPPIAGVAQGAMVLEDALLDTMSYETLTRVCNPKVVGSQLLDEVFHDTPLEFFIVFSSLTAILGNKGQSNYVAANMYMAALAAQRKKRGVAGSAIVISSMIGIGFVERSDDFTEGYFTRLGYRNISEQDLQQLFAEGIRVGHPACTENCEIITGLQPISADSERKAQFYDDVKFGHFVTDRLDVQADPSKASALPVRVLLAAAQTTDDASTIIRDAFLARLKRTLMAAPEDTLSDRASLVEQGIDSLMAVDVRAWFLKELVVDIPVLKILGGASITSLVADAMENMPASIVDLAALARAPAKDAKDAKQPPSSSPPPVTASSSGDGSSESEHAASRDESDSRSAASSAVTEAALEVSTSGVPLNDVENVTGKLTAVQDVSITPSVEAPVELAGLPDQEEETCPMSYGQARFWFLNDYLEDKTSFNMTVMFKLTGRINVPQLTRAVRTLGKRHEALRTRYRWSGTGEHRIPVQGVLAESPVHLVHVRVETEADAYGELQKLHRHVWDLGSWEAAKIRLISVDDNTHFLLVGGHHISWDGYSFTVLFVDLEAAYTGRPLPPLGPESQCRAFAEWQREAYASGSMTKPLEELHTLIPNPDVPPIPPFPFAKSATRPVLDRFIQFEAKATLQAPLVAKLKLLARQNKATMFHVYLAALQGLVLRLLPETDDFFVGVADANRLDKRFMGSLGFFLNLLPVRFGRDGDKVTVGDLVQGARDKARGALERSLVPWNVILAELKVPRTNTHAPIYQLFVDYRQVFQDRSTWGGCQLSDETWLNARNGYDLTLGITDNPTGESWLSIRLTANMYTQAGTDLLMRSYVHVLETMADGGGLPASDLPAYAPADIDRALQVGRGPAMLLDWPATTSHRVDQMVEQHGDAPAIIEGDSLGRTLTYREMAARVDTIAAALVAAGAVVGSPIGVFQNPGADWICSMLAAWRVGGIYVPLDPRNSIARLARIVRAVKPTVLLTHASTTAQTDLLRADNGSDGGGAEIVVSALAPSSTPHLANKAQPDATAVILFTSGTTGEPKGILMTHANLRAESEGYSRACDLPTLARVVLQQTIYGFDVSLDQIVAALGDGGCLVVVPAAKRGDPQAVTQLMAQHGVTYTVATPSEYDMWFRYAPDRLVSCTAWRAAFGGGEHLHDELIHHFAELARTALPRLRLFNNYGPTEATLAITKGEVFHGDPDREEHVPAGFVLPNYAVALLDSHLQPVPVGVAGEICAGGPGVTSGYLDQPALTESLFIHSDQIHPSAAGLSPTWYRTGDRGRLNEDGAVYWLGRIAGDSQVKIRGFRIELQEVEAVMLEAAKGALSHAVVTARGEGESRFLAAHIVFAADWPASRRPAVVRLLESRLPLPTYMQPSVVVALDEIPVTANFKLDRKAVQALPLPDDTADVALVLAAERDLAALWRRVIDHPLRELTPESSFFDVGGNSILLVKLQSLIQSTLRSVPLLVDLMNASSLGSMARLVTSFADASLLDWDAETSIPESLSAAATAGTVVASLHQQRSTIVLAGATGYLGRHLLRRLVESSRVNKVCCLVRDETAAAAAASSALPTHSDKIEWLHADLALPDLGLSPAAFTALANQAAAVVDCAGNRSFFDSYEAFRPVNVAAVKELARLALASHAPLHVLTSGAAQLYAGAAPPTDGSDGYVASKWAAEIFLNKAAARHGLCVRIHRPCAVTDVSHSVEDNAAMQSILQDLAGICRTLGKRPDLGIVSGYVDVVAVDEVVDSILPLVTNITDDDGVQAVEHKAQLRLQVSRFAEFLDSEVDIQALPPMNPLWWFADAKKAGFAYFMTAHHLIMSSEDGKLVARR